MEQISQYIEEKTPKGFTLKIIVNKGAFLVFDNRGTTVYADPAGLKVLHRIPMIAFLGASFSVRNRRISEFTFCKVSKEKIVIPFYVSGDMDMRYLLMDTTETIDLMPIKIMFLHSVSSIAREVEAGYRPDVFVVDAAMSDSDIVVIKNRVPSARVVMADQVVKAGITAQKEIMVTDEMIARATESSGDLNLNTMSKNPVFLARIHLRQMDLSKVNQLLLDFDMVADDALFILSFIQTMISNAGKDPSLKVYEQKLSDLRDDFMFYIALLRQDAKDIGRLIDEVSDPRKFSSYMTLIAKARSMCVSQLELLTIVDYENTLLEKKETFGK